MKRPDFYQYHSWAIEKLGMCTPEMAIFAIIYSYESANKSCFVSFTQFQRLCGLSRSTVAKALNKLEYEYQVIRRYSKECEYNTNNIYEIVIETVAQWQYEYNQKNQKES
jgi:DNA-binding MarR family transcriptional regulator